MIRITVELPAGDPGERLMAAARDGIPLKPGYYWAKWKIPAEGTHEGGELCPSSNWEVVQVNANRLGWEHDPADDEALSVSVPGVRETQWRGCFFWGDYVCSLERVAGRDAPQGDATPCDLCGKPLVRCGKWFRCFGCGNAIA